MSTTLISTPQILADNTFVYEDTGVFCVWQNHWFPDEQTTEIHLDIFTEETPGSYVRHQEDFAERAYALDDLQSWLHKAGFTVEHIYSELTQDPPNADTQRAVFVCKRN